MSTVLGRGDVFAQVLVRDLEALYSFLNDYVESLPGVLETETLVEVQVHKLQFASPPTGSTTSASIPRGPGMGRPCPSTPQSKRRGARTSCTSCCAART